MDYEEFLTSLEGIAINSGFRLVMERAPIGCGILFYFRDGESGLKSMDIWYYPNRELALGLFDKLEQLAKEFRNRLDCNKEEK